MKYLSLLSLLVLAFACKQVHTDEVGKAAHGRDTIAVRHEASIDTSSSPLDSLRMAFIDTSTLEGKIKNIVRNEKLNHMGILDYDTLFDINYDEHKDIIMGWYGMAGTGLKNNMTVYIYSPKLKLFMLDTVLSYSANPSFYLGSKMITSFYLAAGGGGGKKLEWKNGRWHKTMLFEAYNQGDTTVWEISYPLTGKKKFINRPYQMVPPQDILKHNWEDW